MTTFFIFGESQNDTSASSELIQARAEANRKQAHVIPLRSPLIHQKSATALTRKTNAQKVSLTVKARLRLRHETTVVIVAHEDCDNVEPDHVLVANQIERGLAGLGLPIIGAAPAFEMEAWWYLWPAAVAAVCGSWRILQRNNTMVGLIYNAKETLSKDLKPAGRRVREYSEADAPTIAKKVRLMSLIDIKNARSDSFEAFDAKIVAKL